MANATGRSRLGIPMHRPRRLRRTESIRRLVRETDLAPGHLVQPVFVVPGIHVRREIPSMPGIHHVSVDEELDRKIDLLTAARVEAVILFGLPSQKDEIGSENWAPDGVVQRALRRVRARAPEISLFTDLCCCQYTSHGHCGVLRDGVIDNDATLDVLARTAVSHAEAGADFVAPSGMMDGMVAAIRQGLDDADYDSCGILSYAVKYASAFYGPFREAAESAPAFGDRRTYQMDPANIREAIREAEIDQAEGADMLMVKPALAYLDVVRAVREATDLPLAVYNVSGEYAMVKAASDKGWIDERKVVLEALLGMRRAGADLIVSYHAAEVAAWLADRR